MELLKERIVSESRVIGSDILKVDGFINHRVDMELMDAIGDEFVRLFADSKIDCVLTIETSGIPPAGLTAMKLGVPLVFAKKVSSVLTDDMSYEAKVFSFTKKVEYTVRVDRRYLRRGDCVLIIDDFLATGEAILGLKSMITDAGATLAGVGIVIEKGFQKGGEKLRSAGIRVESLAIISGMDNGAITFAN